MSFNGAGLFIVNSAGQPVASGQTIDATIFNALTADLASGLSNCITKDGQTTPTGNIPMATFKLTGLGAGTTNGDSVRYEQLISAAPWGMCDMRLTLSALTPVTTVDNQNNILYWARYKGSRCSIFNGTTWDFFNTGDISINVPAVANQMYDVFVFNNAGSPTLELLAWTNDTTRALALSMQNGILVKSTDATRRYLGSFRTDGTNQANDSMAKRNVFNFYNRVRRPLYVPVSASSYIYTINTYRQANANAANQLEFVIGVSEDVITAEIFGSINNTTIAVGYSIAIGLDSTTAAAALASQQPTDGNSTLVASATQFAGAKYAGFPGIGRHTLVWLEKSSAVGVSVWNIANNAMRGEVWA